jgi:hypothetical protein
MSGVRARPLPRDPRPHRRLRSSVRAALVWAVAASAINVVLWLLARIFGVPFQTVPPDATEALPIGPLIIIGATLFAALLAGIAAGVVGKLVKKAVRWIVVGGTIVTVSSLSGPWGQPAEVPTATRVTLTLMHVAVGALVTFGLSRGMWTDDRAVR